MTVTQSIQIWSINIIHQQIAADIFIVVKGAIDPRQSGMIHPFKDIALKGKASAILFVGIYHLFESKEIILKALISYKIDSAKTTFTKQCFDTIALLHNTANRQNSL